MFLSQLLLKRKDRRAMRLLSDVYTLHKAVMSGFAAHETVSRVLFRREPESSFGDGRNDPVRLLVQSEVEPRWEAFSERAGGLLGSEIRELSPTFQRDNRLRFRLRANPVVKRDGKRRGLVRDESLEDWLRKKEERLGIRLGSFLVVDEGYVTGDKESEGRRVNIKTALFEGVLWVADPDALAVAVASGVGPAKAFGCGLLSLVRA